MRGKCLPLCAEFGESKIRQLKLQTRNTRLQTPEKLEARSAGRGLELGTWDFFGVWSLVFGVSIPGFLWCLVFCFPLNVAPPAPRPISGRIHPSSFLPPPRSGESRLRQSCLPLA